MRRRAAVFFAVLTVLILYTGLQAGRLAPGAPAAEVWAGTLAFFWLIVGWQFFYRSRRPDLESRRSLLLAWSASIALGAWATFIALSLAFDFGRALRLLPWPAHAAAVALAFCAAALALIGLGQARLGPRVVEVSVPLQGLPAGLDGLRIVQISDLHVGPTIQNGYVAKVASLAASLRPDLVAITGDLADGRVSDLKRHVAPLAALSAPLGVYYVTGNHEYYWGAEEWVAEARALGFTPLIGENRVVERGGAKVLVGGIADDAAEHFVPGHRSNARGAAACGEETGLKILLAHRPGAYEEASRAGFDLQLSGHTHGGQFFPYSLLIRLFHRYTRGLNRHGRLWVHVNPGTGYWGPPNRFGVPSEITLLRLRAIS